MKDELDVTDRLASLNLHPLTDEEIQPEIQAARILKHNHASSS